MTCPHDGALMLEDLRFRTDMLSYRLPQRRFVCSMGHARITHVPSSEIPERLIRPPVGFPVKQCLICGHAFESRWKANFCSEACRAEAKRIREREARVAGNTTKQRQARATKGKTKSWNTRTGLNLRGGRGIPIPQVTPARGTGGWA